MLYMIFPMLAGCGPFFCWSHHISQLLSPSFPLSRWKLDSLENCQVDFSSAVKVKTTLSWGDQRSRMGTRHRFFSFFLKKNDLKKNIDMLKKGKHRS